MNNAPTQSDSKQRIEHILSTLNQYRTLWIAPAVVAMALSAVYVSVIRPETWSAKQSLIVRDDLLGQAFKPGRFESIESMKSAQETILEIARKPQVIRNALRQLGPEPTGLFNRGTMPWPSEETIENVQGSIAFHAPNGAEFGKTEVIVLTTKASSRDRSRKFIELLLNEIIVKVDDVRSMRLQSMESELTQARDTAIVALNQSKSRLQEMDESLGSDIGTMNLLDNSQSSDNTLKGDISQIRLEKRQTETELESLENALSQLMTARDNPEGIFTTSAALISLLPALDDLKKALITTQGELAVMAGQYEPAHPSYRKAKNSIEAMKQQMHLELDASIAGVQNDITLTKNRLHRLHVEMTRLDDRLINLGSKRANLMTLVADLRKRTEIANNAQSDLSEIQGLAQSRHAELISRVDEPQVSTRPDGMGKKSTVLAAGLGGLMIGLGLVMLIAPTMNPRVVEELAEEFHTREASTETVTAKPIEQATPATDPGEPSISDLLDEVASIATPARVAAQPLASPARKIEIRPTAPKSPKRKFTVRPINPSTLPNSANSVVETSTDKVSAGRSAATDAGEFAGKPVDEFSAIQLAALRGTQVERVVTPQTLPAATAPNSNQPLEVEPLVVEMDNEAASLPVEIASAIEVKSQSITVPDLRQPGSFQTAAKESRDQPVSNPVAELTRRSPNVRPVDLVKSADEGDSTFVRNCSLEARSELASDGNHQ